MFSIVMPLWNKRRMVAATLASALAQSWRGFELIIVDDGSTDGSLEETETFDDPRIRRLRQPNAGPGAARNAAIRAARHDWFAFLDADDLWLPDHLDELDRIRRRFPEAGLIGTTILRSNRKGQCRIPPRGRGCIAPVDFFESAACGRWPVTTSSAAIPRRTYEELGGFGDAPCGQDMEYWGRIALDREVAVSSRPTAVYVLGTSGISETALSRWVERDFSHWGDVSPSMALLHARQADIDASARRAAIELFIDRQLQFCARNAARLGDFRTLRALPRLYPRRPPPGDRLLFALARGPAPLARAGFRLGLGLKALLRALRAKRGAPTWAAPRSREIRQCSGGTAASRLAAAVAPAQSELA
jgi:glycosyltransferase involved in cell wall biosynthesis